MRASMLAVLAALLIAGCSSSPKIVSGTQQSVVIQYDGTDVKHATKVATTYCTGLGKQAVLQGSSMQDKQALATFNCL
ncbi:MAG TPA: hypothetical protein VJ747_17025 [Stellaceae bacterium]|nr:hypothetical protein [Stellaceae bacterium]